MGYSLAFIGSWIQHRLDPLKVRLQLCVPGRIAFAQQDEHAVEQVLQGGVVQQRFDVRT